MEPNRAPRVRAGWMTEIILAILWAQVLDAFGTSGLVAGRILALVLRSHEGQGGNEA